MKNLKEKTLKGFIWLLFGSGIQVTVQIGVLAILARIISKEDFGIAQSALIVIGFSNLLSQLGVGPAIVQKKELTKNLLRSGFTISLVSGTILGIIVYLGAGAISSFFNMPALKEILQVVSVLFVLQSMVIISEGLMQRNMQMKQLATSNFLSYTLGYGVVAVTLGYHNYGVWAIIYGSISQTIVKGIIVSIYQPHSYRPYFNKKDYYELLHYGGGFTIARFANYFAGQGDNIVAGKYLGAYALGIYSRAYGIMAKPVNLIGTAIDKVLFPAMASRQDDREKLINAFLKGSQLMHSVALPVGLMIAIAAQDIIVVLLGKNWLEVTVPLQILSVGLLFKMSYKMGDSLARSTGLIYKRALRQIVFAISMVVFSYCGHFYGINGIAVGAFCSILLNYMMMMDLSLKYLKISWSRFIKSSYDSFIFSILISGMYFLILLSLRHIIESSILRLIISGIIQGLLLFIVFARSPKLMETYGIDLFVGLIKKRKK